MISKLSFNYNYITKVLLEYIIIYIYIYSINYLVSKLSWAG